MKHDLSFLLVKSFFSVLNFRSCSRALRIFFEDLFLFLFLGVNKISAEMKQPVTTISLITEALMQPLDYDYRNQFSKPVFRQCLEDINSLQTGMLMTGEYLEEFRITPLFSKIISTM